MVPLPHADAARVSVAKVDAELSVTSGGRRRAVVLPRSLARLDLAGARLVGGELRVALREAGPA